jgi:hypothetical protein
LGVLIVGYNSSYAHGNIFLINKYSRIVEIGNKCTGSTELLGKLYLSNSTGSTEVSCKSDGIQFSKKDNPNDKVIIPFGKDLTSFNKAIFRQSIIDYTIINNPNGNLYQTNTNGQKYSTTIKTIVDENVFPKTTNTLFTLYYTSYIKNNLPGVTDTGRKVLLYYYCTDETNPAIEISVNNSTYYQSPLIFISKL